MSLVIFGFPGSANNQVATYDAAGSRYRYSAAVSNLALPATPTDVVRISMASELRRAWIRTIEVTAIGDTAAAVTVNLRRTSNEVSASGATEVTPELHDANQPGSEVKFFTRTSNPAAPADAKIVRSDKLQVGTASAIGNKIVWEFDPGFALKNIQTWLQIGFAGGVVPANTLLTVTAIWEEETPMRAIISGDSTTSNALKLFQTLSIEPNILRTYDIRNFGNNGVPLVDAIANSGAGQGGTVYAIGRADAVGINTVTTALPATYPVGIAGKVIFCWGINDVRQGACDLATLISRIDTALTLINTARPDAEIILWGPNSLTTDDYGSHGYVTTTNAFTGMTLAQAAQAATDIMYDAYASFADDSRVSAVVQKQDIFGRACTTVAGSNGLMGDQLHPSDRGQYLSAQQILAYL